jgi:hypothetical protein
MYKIFSDANFHMVNNKEFHLSSSSSESKPFSQAWWHTTVISALGRLRQENHKSEASLGYIAKPCLKKKKKRKEGI